jgi:hypothetical protein
MNSYMLSVIIKEKTGKDLFDLLYERIFEPMGITEVYWEKCPKGISKGGWGLYMKIEDTLKFGKLFLDHGVWNGKRLISSAWLAEMTKKQSAPSPAMNENGYGYHIWRSVREDSYQMNGMFGQNLFIFPDICMTIAINSASSEFFPKGRLFSLIDRYFGNQYHPSQTPLRPARRAYSALCTLAAELSLPPIQKKQEKMKNYTALLPLADKEFSIGGKNAAILPITLSLFHANFAGGINKIAFRLCGDRMETLFTSPQETITIPFSMDGTATYFDLTENGECFSVASIGKMTQTEDGVPVFKLSIYFLETTAVRHFKIFFHRTKTVVRFSEEPTASTLLEEFSPVLGDFVPSNKQIKNLLSEKDSAAYEIADYIFTLDFVAK